MSTSELEIVLAVIDQAFDRRSWHGTNLRGSIRGMTAEQAAWRPAPGRLNAWELVMHAAYWKYTARRRLLAEARGSFPARGSNIFARPDERGATASAWASDVRLLVETHKALRDAVARLPPAELRVTPPGSKVSNVTLLTGIAAHDLYHAGQIQLLKRLRES